MRELDCGNPVFNIELPQPCLSLIIRFKYYKVLDYGIIEGAYKYHIAFAVACFVVINIAARCRRNLDFAYKEVYACARNS